MACGREKLFPRRGTELETAIVPPSKSHSHQREDGAADICLSYPSQSLNRLCLLDGVGWGEAGQDAHGNVYLALGMCCGPAVPNMTWLCMVMSGREGVDEGVAKESKRQHPHI